MKNSDIMTKFEGKKFGVDLLKIIAIFYCDISCDV